MMHDAWSSASKRIYMRASRIYARFPSKGSSRLSFAVNRESPSPLAVP